MRLVASDMDGTVVGNDGRMSERTIRAFRACAESGVDVVFVTGRPPRWLQPLKDQLGHTGTVICSNGPSLSPWPKKSPQTPRPRD